MTVPVAEASRGGILGLRRRRDALAPTYVLFLVTVAVALVRARNQPDLSIGIGGTTVSITPADVLLAALLGAIVVNLGRARTLPGGSRAALLAAGAFAAWLFLSSLPNGASAVVAAGKLVELGVLSLAAWVLLDRIGRLEPLILLIVAMTIAAATQALIGGLNDPGRRQSSFLGEHDMALLSTLALSVGFTALVARHGLGRLPLVAGIFGALGITFGASFAGLLGVYFVGAAVVLIAAARRSLTRRATVLVALTCLAVTAGTLMLRSDNLGFLYEWLGRDETAEPGEHAGSWSSRLIYAYVGGRIFLDNPVVGTGWYGELPPQEYARYLPDAHDRFPDQPAHYFPPEDGTFIPQQTYDQVLYELGIVGAVLLLALGIAAVRAAVSVARRWPPGDPGEYAAYLPMTWLLAAAGALAGSALFGGTPLATLFWLVVGVVVAARPPRAERAPRFDDHARERASEAP